MKITDLIDLQSIRIDISVKDKNEMLYYLSELMFSAGKVSDREKFEEALKKREEQSTTAVGEKIAVPHAKDISVKKGNR